MDKDIWTATWRDRRNGILTMTEFKLSQDLSWGQIADYIFEHTPANQRLVAIELEDL